MYCGTFGSTVIISYHDVTWKEFNIYLKKGPFALDLSKLTRVQHLQILRILFSTSPSFSGWKSVILNNNFLSSATSRKD